MQEAPAARSPSSGSATPADPDRRDELRAVIEAASHYLPTQGPISVFVHHNTLHAFEELPFEQAVIEGGKLFGCEPYLSEDRYRGEWRQGRIRSADLEAVLLEDLGEIADQLIADFGTRYALRLAMLQAPLRSAPDVELHWLVAESDTLARLREDVPPNARRQLLRETRDWAMQTWSGNPSSPAITSAERGHRLQMIAEPLLKRFRGRPRETWSRATWEAFTLQLLWRVCQQGVLMADPPDAVRDQPVRHRDLLLETTGEDIDVMVNEVLIRFSSAFIDQGFAAWGLPDREEGFFAAFAHLYRQRFSPCPRWMRGVPEELSREDSGGWDPLNSIARSLELFEVDASESSAFIKHTLLALDGWAGMIWQLETNAPWMPMPAPAGTLHDFLAVRLILERYAIGYVARKRWGTESVTEALACARQQRGEAHPPTHERRAFTLFQLAQLRAWSPLHLAGLTASQWDGLVREVESFSALEHRRVFHSAYERRYRNAALDAVATHAGRRRQLAAQRAPDDPAYKVVCCIDDREESFRRQLEEVDRECETFGAAGFYGVAMYYQGATHAHYRPLCPNAITPQHYVREEPVFSAVDVDKKRSRRRRLLGHLTHRVHAGSRTLVGGAITGVLGSLATFPLVAGILAPRITARLRESVGAFVRPPATELHLERSAAEPGDTVESLGYSVDEMAAVVTRILQDIGLVSGTFSPLVLFVGHGSSSLNNPHESAYNCGACSGGRGGPNARAFAEMANDPRVRALCAEGGLSIPDHVRFLGAYHNTCNDHVEYFDLDRLPWTHRALFRRMEASINQTRARDAHERVRRFESASLDLSPQEALEHVEQRAEDLSQARPEYNHATNALCFVGRREWSRGLFLDRRAFLTSYDPAIDDEQAGILTRILQAAIPVGAGISLEYYFSTVDTEGYGCGSKLPHNVAALTGVMTGAASDLRPGLSAQLVEIHEPLRILFVIETTPQVMQSILDRQPAIARLVEGHWVQLAVLNSETSEIQYYSSSGFSPYHPESSELAEVDSSEEWYRGKREHLGFASIRECEPRVAEPPQPLLRSPAPRRAN